MKKSFQWYYFDLHSEDGYDFVFTLHSRPFMTQFAVSIFDFFIYKDNRLLKHRFFSKPESSLQRNHNKYEVYFDEQNYILYDKRTIRVRAKNAHISLDLTLSNIAAGSEIPERNLLTGDSPSDFFVWKLIAPLCRARAAVNMDGQEFSLQGRGYHDYNAGNIILNRELRSWRWSKFYFPQKLVIIGEVVPREGKAGRILVVATQQGTQWSEDFRLSENRQRIKLQSRIVDFDFLRERFSQLDDIRFLLLNPPGIFAIPAKMFEMAIAIMLQFKFLNPLTKMLTNVRYVRQRLSGQNSAGKQVSVFQEEIFF